MLPYFKQALSNLFKNPARWHSPPGIPQGPGVATGAGSP